jgi:uncharacterized protein
MPNRLAKSTSPYLLQHKDNPVDWYPWSDEALKRARDEDKPIFLSIGYSACHWCHVMEHESFENEEIAKFLNANFICIKVDREERPDIDQIYMNAVQMLTGSGGWPMSVFLKPNGQPFYGGTYWPPESRFGRPGFLQVISAIADAWKGKREQLDQQGELITQHLREACLGPKATERELKPEWLTAADRWLLKNFDRENGGFGNAPKFPHSIDLQLLIELDIQSPLDQRQQCVKLALDKMAQGGIFDHLGGGFARYSVDARWLVPHFEKMLYDNALLLGTYSDAYRLWGDAFYVDVIHRTATYILTRMTNADGGFFSSEDADSEGEEGKFYVWSDDEVRSLLDKDRADVFCDVYDVSSKGNFEGHNILNLRKPIHSYAVQYGQELESFRTQLEKDRKRLFEVREKRVHPALDDKTLLSWNGLMVTGMVKAYRATGEPRYLQAALKCVAFVRQNMRRPDGRLWHTCRLGQASVDAYLDDYGSWLDALSELIQVAMDSELVVWAKEVADILLKDFQDKNGGFFYTADSHETLIAKSKDMADSSIPSGNALAASGLLTLGRMLGRTDYVEAATKALQASSAIIAGSPQAAGQSLRVLNRALQPSRELVLIGGNDHAAYTRVSRALLRQMRPDTVVAICPNDAHRKLSEGACPLLENRIAVRGDVTLYACSDFVCQAPMVGLEAIAQFLGFRL